MQTHTYYPHPDHVSIFGDTYEGVPNPQIPHVHPYPTRHHGPLFYTPRFGLPYKVNPMAVPPYSGLGASSPDGLGGCGCGGIRKSGGETPEEFAGLEGYGEPILCSSSGTYLDAMLGAAAGYFAAPSKSPKDIALYAGGGALAGVALGTVGVVAMGVLAAMKLVK